MIKQSFIYVLFALLSLPCVSHAENYISDEKFAESLEGAGAPSDLFVEPGSMDPERLSRGKPKLYAKPVLQGSQNEHISLIAMDDSGDRVITERITGGLIFSSTYIQVLDRKGSSWNARTVLSRGNGDWIGGVTLSALALSGDGRYLVFNWMEDKKDHDSSVFKILDLKTGEKIPLGKGRAGRVSKEDIERMVKIVTESSWFNQVYPGKSWEDVFPESGEGTMSGSKRCSGSGKLKAHYVSHGYDVEEIYRSNFVVEKSGVETLAYPLNKLPGTRAWAWQGAFDSVYNQDCTRGMTTIDEVLESTRGSFFYGGEAHNAHKRLIEFGATYP